MSDNGRWNHARRTSGGDSFVDGQSFGGVVHPTLLVWVVLRHLLAVRVLQQSHSAMSIRAHWILRVASLGVIFILLYTYK